MKKVLFLVQLPEPYHGVSSINELIVKDDRVQNELEIKTISLNYSNSISSLNKVGFTKLFKLVSFWVRCLFLLTFWRPQKIYFTIVPKGMGFFRDVLFVFLGKLFRKEMVFHIHGTGVNDFLTTGWKSRMYRWVFKNSTVIHLSEQLFENDFGRLRIHGLKKCIVANPLLNDSISKVPKEASNVLFLSNLFPFKGIYDFIKILAAIKKELPSVHAQVIGGFPNPEIKAEIDVLIAKYALQNNIQFHGELRGAKKEEVMNRCKVICYPTHDDAYPLTLIECMFKKISVVASKVGAIPEMLGDGKRGSLYESGDVVGFKDGVVKALEHKTMTEVEAAELFTLENSSRDVFITKIIRILKG